MGASNTLVAAVVNAFAALDAWFHAPFRQTAYSPQTYVYLVGLVLIIAWFWFTVANHMEREI